MGGQNTESTNYTTHVVVFLTLTVFMYVFAFVLVDHSKDVPARVDTVHADKKSRKDRAEPLSDSARGRLELGRRCTG